MIIRVIGITMAVLVLAACSHEPPPPPGGGPGPHTMGGPPGGFAPGSQQDLAANAGDRVFFAYDQATISPEGQQILQRQAEWLKRYSQVSVTIEGHCDERGTREYNLALGERRAAAVRNVLVAMGVSPGRIKTISYGKERPIIVGSSEEGYAQNRVGITTVNGG